MTARRTRLRRQSLSPAAEADRLLARLETPCLAEFGEGGVLRLPSGGRKTRFPASAAAELLRAGLIEEAIDGAGRRLSLTGTGRSRLARLRAEEPDRFLAQHAPLRRASLGEGDEARTVTVNDGESPLAWLFRRKGPDGAPLISAAQFAAGERLRAELTRAQIMPRVTANWTAAVASGPRGADAGQATDAMIAARQRIDRALAAAGPEFSGLLIDVCGFLKRLPDIERERRWPARSAKLVLDMALTRLARHYGLIEEAAPPRSPGLRFWGAAGYRPSIDGTADIAPDCQNMDVSP